ncbi:TraR/DksA family transcriptional regulator [Escherichia coli]|uniref:TraR/DksA family transcriptional regulator n=1 Tax=Escherichia coli TaxID=562 RepID=UPI003F52D1F2
MPDNVDFIQAQQAELLERQINAARVKHCGASAMVCEECDAPIPAARRAAYRCLCMERATRGRRARKTPYT